MPELTAATAEERNATASWSGYVYQGKVGILVGLKNISEIYAADTTSAEANLQGWSLEYETFEDFDIKSSAGVVSRHQVKAKKVANAHTKGAYSSALRAFDATNCPKSGRFLHTICAVTNWDDSTVSNPSEVQLYKYPDGNLFCDVAGDEIQNFALKYLKIIRPDDTEKVLLQIYYYLNYLVLDEVNTNHTTNPSLDLSQLYQTISTSPVDEMQNEINSIRLKSLLVKSLCELENELQSSSEELGISWAEAEARIEELCKLEWEELERFLMNIHPTNSDFARDHDFNSVGFKDVFLELIRNVHADFNMDIRGYRHNKETFIASTINNEPRARVELARQIVTNPNNAKAMFEGKNIVTKSIDYDFSNLMGGEYDERYNENILNPNKMKFIQLDEAKRALTEGES